MPVKLFGLKKTFELAKSQQADLETDMKAYPSAVTQLATRRSIPQPLMKPHTYGKLGDQTDVVEGGTLRNQLLGKVDLRKRMGRMINKKNEDERIRIQL